MPNRRRRVVLLTRTDFSEPPRLRAQVAALLTAHGHEVLFVERPRWLRSARVDVAGPPWVATAGELVHHQLRIARALTRANASYVRSNLKLISMAWSDAAIINFNYDYWMARELWAANQFVTIINDDFIHVAKRWAKAEARWAQRETLAASSAALAVSYPLVRQCMEDTSRASLFLPWARTDYAAPARGGSAPRDLLFWGFLDRRVDWVVVEALAARGITIHFVGPIVADHRRARRAFQRPNIEYHGAAALSEIPDVLARCVASILPYDLATSSMEITISNRAFDLLSHGLPLLYADFPELLVAPADVIHRCRSVDDYAAAWESACLNTERSQASIQEFLTQHTASVRYEQLTPLID